MLLGSSSGLEVFRPLVANKEYSHLGKYPAIYTAREKEAFLPRVEVTHARETLMKGR